MRLWLRQRSVGIAYPAFLLTMVVIGFANYYLLKWSTEHPIWSY